MKLVISNIAWTNEEEPQIAQLLQELGIKYVEVAPTKIWDEPVEATDEQIQKYLDFWSGYGIQIVAFQSMLFTHPEMKIFEDETNRHKTLEYLKRFTGLAGKMGAKVLVFGSPKNRQRGDMPLSEAKNVARAFFVEVGTAAQQNNTLFCIEPNPVDYACDFVVNANEGMEFVKLVGEPGFGLHLDIAGMTLAGDDVPQAIVKAGSDIKHFHISAPFLEQVEDRKDVDYRGAAEALRNIDYGNFVSIEMKPGTNGTNVARVEKALRFAQQIFG